MKWTSEAKVGAFSILGIIAFVIAMAFLSHVSLFQPPQMHIRGEFGTVTGLKVGNPVNYSGVPVGKVTALTVNPKGVTVDMDINKDTEIPKNSKFSLSSDGIIGDKFIQISPGNGTTYLADGDIIYGEGRSEVDKGMEAAGELMGEANKSLKSINNIIGDPETQTSLRNALRTTDDIMANTAAMTAQMNTLISQNSGNVNELTANMVTITRNMNHLTAQLDTSMQRLDGDGSTSENIKHIVTNMKSTTDSLDKMAHSMEGVITDPKSAEDIKETLHNTAQITGTINKWTGGKSYASTKKDSNGAVNENNKDAKADDKKNSGPLGISAEANLEMLYNDTKEDYSPNFNFRVFKDKTMVEIGASHIGDGTDLELNYGRMFNDKFTIRGGIFDGDVGLGLDYGLRGPFSFSAAVIDPNHRRYRFRSELKLYKDWFAVAQLITPFDRETGGRYFGIKKNF